MPTDGDRSDAHLARLTSELTQAIAASREELLSFCAALVAAPSVNPPGDTTAPAAVVTRFLEEHAVEPSVLAAVPAMPNVVATCAGGRPGPHLVLNVHLDTMEPGPVDAWSVPITEATRRDGRLYGLGVGNMKGAVAAMCLAFVELGRRRAAWPGRVTLTAVSDEVIFGDHGAAHLLAVRPDLVGDGLLCGEGPGFLHMAVGEKGLLWLELQATGPGGHASAVKRGTSAVVRLAQAITAVDTLNGWDSPPPGELRHALPAGHAARLLTANVGLVQAGTVANQLAREARAIVDLRVPPGLTLGALQTRIADMVAPLGVQARRVKGWEANWTDPRAPLARAIRAAAARVRSEEPHDVVRLPASDASRWRARGVQAVCYGPQLPLSVGADEYAREQDIVDCALVYAVAAIDFLHAPSPARGER